MRPMMRELEWVGGPAILSTGGVLALQATQAVSDAAVTFGPGEITVVGLLLAGTTGALSLVFKLLLAAQEKQITLLQKQNAGLELLLSQTTTLSGDQGKQLVGLLTGIVQENHDVMQELVTTVKAMNADQAERHTEFMAAVGHPAATRGDG